MFSESVKDIGVLLETSLKDLYEKSKVGSLNIERGSLGNTQIAGERPKTSLNNEPAVIK